MACTSGSVQTVADKTVAAKAQIDKLVQMLKQQEEANKGQFFAEIGKHLADAKVSDAREISYNSDIKTEYTSEFSLDKIAGVVTSALKVLAAAKNLSVGAPATSPEAIAAYVDVVTTVAEAAKSSSTASGSLSFSMNRLSPGLFAFLYASSVNIKDEDTFGSEAVTTTAIYYRFMQSIDDVKHEAAFGAAILDAQSFLKMKTLQADLLNRLDSGKPNSLTIEDWTKLDDAYSKQIEKMQARLAADALVRPKAETPAMALSTGSAATQKLVHAAIQRLSAKGDAYKVVVETSKARLASLYY